MPFTEPFRQVLYTAEQWSQVGHPSGYDVTPDTAVIAFEDSSEPRQIVNVSFAEGDQPLAERVNRDYPLVDAHGKPVKLPAPSDTPSRKAV